MRPYRKFRVPSAPTSNQQQHPLEAREWMKLKYLSFMENYGAVTRIEFSPTENEFAVTSSSVSFYSTRNPEKIKEITQFKRTPFCGTYRKDGKLIAVGGGYPVVNIFQVETSISLRELAGHTAPIRAVSFSPSEATKLVSGSDDQTVRIWEINTGDAISILHGHEDSVRTLLPTHGDHLWITGSYDGSSKMWDLRKKECVTSFIQNSPVESLALLSGNEFASAGGAFIKVWDLRQSSLHTKLIDIHQKTVTSIAYDPISNCLLSGSLEHLFKVYSLTSDQTIYTTPYKHPITSIAFSKDRGSLAVGQTNGLVNLRSVFPPDPTLATRKMKEHAEQANMLNPQEAETKTNELVFRRSDSLKAVKPRLTDKALKLEGPEKYLRKFEYRQALDEIFQKKNINPVYATALLAELDHRDGLLIALSSRDVDSLYHILCFVNEYILRPEYCSLLVKVLSLIVDLYYDKFGLYEVLDIIYKRVASYLHTEMDTCQSAMSLMGNLEFILNNNNNTTQNVVKEEEPTKS